MQEITTDELHIVMHHVPFHLSPTRDPTGAVNRLIAYNFNVAPFHSQLTVEFSSSDLQRLILRKASCRFLHHGIRLWQQLQQHIFDLLGHLLFDGVHLVIQPFFFLHRSAIGLRLGLQLGYFGILSVQCRGNALTQIGRLGAQLVVADGLKFGVLLVDLNDERLCLLNVLIGLGAEKFPHKRIDEIDHR